MFHAWYLGFLGNTRINADNKTILHAAILGGQALAGHDGHNFAFNIVYPQPDIV